MSIGFYFDAEKCSGCHTCQVACKDRFDLQEIGPRPRRVRGFECGAYPSPTMFYLAISCNHCETPACVKACPTRAMHVDQSSNVVLHDDDLCVGCRACVMACPYGAPQYVSADRMVQKCDTCMALRDAGGKPVCVEACIMRALDFGEIDDLKIKYGDNLVQQYGPMPSADITHPNILIHPRNLGGATEFSAVDL